MDSALEHRLTSIEERVDRHKERIDSHDISIVQINNELKEIVKLLSSRPTWLTAGLFATITSVTSGLIVYVLTVHH